jgi:hypothetical protein
MRVIGGFLQGLALIGSSEKLAFCRAGFKNVLFLLFKQLFIF